jgi:hypothetical protein
LWLGGFLSVAAFAGVRWRRLRASARRAQRVSNFPWAPSGVAVLISHETGEPGVFGILRPTLILPADIVDSLRDHAKTTSQIGRDGVVPLREDLVRSDAEGL